MMTTFDEVLLEEDPVRQADGLAELACNVMRRRLVIEHGLDDGSLDIETEEILSAETLVRAVERLDSCSEAADSAAQALALELNYNGKFHAVNESETFEEALATVYKDAEARGPKYIPRMVEVVPKLAANAGVQPKQLIAPLAKSKTEEAVGSYNRH